MPRRFWLIVLLAVLWALWPIVAPSPPSVPSDACAEAQLLYEHRPTRARLDDVLRRCTDR